MKTSALILAATLPMPALAHSGHGTFEATSLFHYLMEPFHAVWVLALVVGLGVAFGLRRRLAARRGHGQPSDGNSR